MKEGQCWEANRFTDNQEISLILWKTKVRDRVHKTLNWSLLRGPFFFNICVIVSCVCFPLKYRHKAMVNVYMLESTRGLGTGIWQKTSTLLAEIRTMADIKRWEWFIRYPLFYAQCGMSHSCHINIVHYIKLNSHMKAYRLKQADWYVGFCKKTEIVLSAFHTLWLYLSTSCSLDTEERR
jgi:hypothetical protein